MVCDGLTGRVAAYDIGSNTTRGLLAVPTEDGAMRVLAADQRMTALGRGLSGENAFDPEALDATVRFLSDTLKRWERPEDVHAVATAAARAATNGPDLIARLRDEAGVEARIIDGEEEARLAWLGALSEDPHLAANRPAVVDIVGRSTEVVAEEDGRLDAISRPPGARSLTEGIVESDLPWDMRHRQHLSTAEILLPDSMRKAAEAGSVICIGGTAQSAARLLGGTRITEQEIADLALYLAQLSPQERRERMAFDPERAEIIYGGLVILELFARCAPDQTVTISEGGVREGLLLDRTGARRLEW
ncbi:MAG: hypothetical protein GF393_07015 [Armatimonadia bacterium]|nr:hypothetical protein [Armatimonadia bacterium]